MNKLTSDIKLYAKLLQSVGRQGQGLGQSRPLSPVDCAYCIQRLINEEGDTLEQVSERLGLGKSSGTSSIYKKRDTSQIVSFLNLLKVSEKSRSFAGWGYEKYPKISFSIISQLSSLTPTEQDIVIQSIFASNNKKLLGKDDIKQIKKWKRENPNISIKTYVEQFLKLKPTTNITHMVVSEMHGKLKKFVTSNSNYREKLLRILNRNLNGDFFDLHVSDLLVTISMNETAYEIFHDKQYKNGVSFTSFLNGFLEDKI